MSGKFVEARLSIYDAMVDILSDLAEPAPHEVEEVRSDMMNVAEILMDVLDVTVVGTEDDIVTVTVQPKR